MENIKNTAEDNGKIVIRISNEMAFSYSFQEDEYSIAEDINNYRYATGEEAKIYTRNKYSDNRFYCLYNAPELRDETMKKRIQALPYNKYYTKLKPMFEQHSYEIVKSDIARKYWEHELHESKDKEIESLKKQVAGLTKDLSETNKLLDHEVASHGKSWKKLDLLEKKTKILIDALLDVQNWDDELEEKYEDPGYIARRALVDFKTV